MTPRERADGAVAEWARQALAGKTSQSLIGLIERQIRLACEAEVAADRAARAVPGAPLTEGELARLRADLAAWRGTVPRETLTAYERVMAHVAYLEQVLGDALASGEADAWRRGRDAGLEEAAGAAETHPLKGATAEGATVTSAVAAAVRSLKAPRPDGAGG